MPGTESTIISSLNPRWVEQMLIWGRQHFSYFGYFHSNNIPYPQGGFDHVFYAGNRAEPLEKISNLPQHKPKIGIIGYDQKNRYENLSSRNASRIECPDSLFLVPRWSSDLARIAFRSLRKSRMKWPTRFGQRTCPNTTSAGNWRCRFPITSGNIALSFLKFEIKFWKELFTN